MKILVLNCGSSSIKYQLINMRDNAVMGSGIADKVGNQGSCVKHETQDGQKIVFNGDILDHKQGIEYVLGIISSEKYGCIKSFDEIDAVGHRVVHGGERFSKSQIITEELLEVLEELSNLAPLHNPPNLKGIRAMESIIPEVPQVAVFDTAFHQTMPEHAYLYALPYALYQKYGIRRYGFHGTSHLYVSKRACELAGKELATSKIITCHLGNGASIAAIDGGKSVDTSMGFTPNGGLVMGTRCGDIDPGIVPYLIEKERIGSHSLSVMINKHSGILGITGKSSDMRDVEDGVQAQEEKAIRAFEMYVYQIKKYIGAYVAAMNGVDLIVFTGGVGENGGHFREEICADMDFFGVELNKELNQGLMAKEARISVDNARVDVWVVPTNEELVIAQDTAKLIS